MAVFPKIGANRLNIMVKMRIRAFDEWTISRVQELLGSDEDLKPLDLNYGFCENN